MKNFKYLESKTIDQLKESVELGKKINQCPIRDIYEHAENLSSNH